MDEGWRGVESCETSCVSAICVYVDAMIDIHCKYIFMYTMYLHIYY